MGILNDDCSTSDGENTLILDGESGDEMIENEKNQSTMKSKKKRRTRSSRRTKVDQYDVAVGDEKEISCQWGPQSEWGPQTVALLPMMVQGLIVVQLDTTYF